ncbi:uncharacterized protein LOC133837059 [Drosophila sulfurigaster albostrigata]|uniref:uncharacterized protein LOC133837059 n=1 Tax=Drosophila sulfurigaster albostrigata TaxID=89887 RepID=UPI002D21C0CC|nr:uncharacterized protein LOC133837059 [Drosophila sulfurigaster albostrigata]
MVANIKVFVILMLTAHQSCFGYYIRKSEESSPTKQQTASAIKSQHNDEWGAIQNTLGLSQEKVELLKSQKDQQGTKELLNRFIKENPKYLTSTKNKHTNTNANANAIKPPSYQFKRLLRALAQNLKSSNRMLKTSFNFELADRPLKSLKRPRRKIAVKMVSDMSSEHVDNLIKMFYEKHNIQPEPDYYNDRIVQDNEDEGDYSEQDIPRQSPSDVDPDSDYEYDNLYDDERDVGLTAKMNRNLEYGSFQDLILQANRNEWEREHEETKLHNTSNDHFI